MKLHDNYIEGISSILKKVFDENSTADFSVQQTLKSNPKWGGRDRRCIAKAAYEIIRNYRYYSFKSDSIDLVDIIKYYWEFPKTSDGKKEKFEIEYSIPDELLSLLKDEIEEGLWKKEIEASHGKAPMYIRVNTSKISVNEFSIKLTELSINHKIVDVENQLTIELEERLNAKDNELYLKGFFEFQDLGSQMIGSFLSPGKSTLLIDACAGAGGKSLHLSNLMDNTGNIIALDVSEVKLKNLIARAKRNGAKNIIVKAIAATTIHDMEEMADILLLDVPCTGSGTMRRQPEIKFRLNRDYLNEKIIMQEKILDTYSSMLKRGGMLVYSTCSIFPSENRKQIDQFLVKHSDFSFVEERQLYSHKENTDGFYMAKLRRK